MRQAPRLSSAYSFWLLSVIFLMTTLVALSQSYARGTGDLGGGRNPDAFDFVYYGKRILNWLLTQSRNAPGAVLKNVGLIQIEKIDSQTALVRFKTLDPAAIQHRTREKAQRAMSDAQASYFGFKIIAVDSEHTRTEILCFLFLLTTAPTTAPTEGSSTVQRKSRA